MFLIDICVFLLENNMFALSARPPGTAPNEPEACRDTKTIILITNCNTNSNGFGGAAQMRFLEVLGWSLEGFRPRALR